MTEFYICRHGETENNRDKKLSGWFDTPLTEKGVQNARATADKLRGLHFDKVFSSDLGRAYSTAQIITEQIGFQDEINQLRGLREVNYGVLADQPIADYPPKTPEENSDFVPEGGESLRHMQVRVLTCITELATQNPAMTLLLVAHDGVINAVRSAISGTPIGIVDAKNENGHDFVGKFTVSDQLPEAFSEIG